MALQQNQPFPMSYLNLAGGKSCLLANQIRDDQADDCLNVYYEDGNFNTRPGQAQLFTSLGAGQVNNLDLFQKPDGTTVRMLHWSTNLYTQTASSAPVQIYTELANAKPVSKPFNGAWYSLDGSSFIRYDGTTVTDLTTIGYVPTITKGRKPDGSQSQPGESLNYLSNSFKDSFSSDGTTAYQLSIVGLTSVDSVTVNGVAKVAGTDYTVDLTNGKVNFVTGPANGGTDNVLIQGTKTGLMDKTKITKNNRIYIYANRLWLLGDANIIYYSGLTGIYTQDATYWPEDGWRIANGNDYCMNWGLVNNELILVKENSIEGCSYSLDSSGNAQFTWRDIYTEMSCDCPYTVLPVNNYLVFLHSSKGLGVLHNTLVQDKLNVTWISFNINGTIYKPGILNQQKADLQNAVVFDDGKRLWICVKDNAFVWDYTIVPFSPSTDPKNYVWWPMSNINASVWLLDSGTSYFGDRTNGIVQKLTPGVYNDNGSDIKPYWRSKEFDFGAPEWLKAVNRMWIRPRPGTGANVKHITDLDTKADAISSGTTDMFNWDSATFWDTPVWDTKNTSRPYPLRPKLRKINTYQVEFSGTGVNQNLSILAFSLEVTLNKKIK